MLCSTRSCFNRFDIATSLFILKASKTEVWPSKFFGFERINIQICHNENIKKLKIVRIVIIKKCTVPILWSLSLLLCVDIYHNNDQYSDPGRASSGSVDQIYFVCVEE